MSRIRDRGLSDHMAGEFRPRGGLGGTFVKFGPYGAALFVSLDSMEGAQRFNDGQAVTAFT